MDGAEIMTLDLDKLMSGAPFDLEALAKLDPARRPLVLNLPAPKDGAPPRWRGEAIAQAFGRLAARIIKLVGPGAVFLSGGDTAREVLAALGAADLEIASEPKPGIVHLASGGLSLLTKSGGFGHPDLLSELWRESFAPKA
jgi:hypothetical protein